jgi:soluble lytic murein transglycosylase-like protein
MRFSVFNRLLAAIIITVPVVASAGTVYRCVGDDMVTQYVETRIAGARCEVVKVASYNHEKLPLRTPARPVEQAAVESTPAAAKANAPSSDIKFLRMGYSTSYVWVDADGIKHFASSRPRGVANVQVKRTEYPIFSIPACYACTASNTVSFGNVRLNMQAFAAEIKRSAAKYGVDEAIVRAIIHAESAYRPHVVSPKNAQGLMQLIPATAKRFGVKDPFDPAQNIEGGVQYLAWLLKRYKNDLTLAAAAYNAGEGAVDRFKGVPPYRETRNYVVRVGQLAERYRKALNSG